MRGDGNLKMMQIQKTITLNPAITFLSAQHGKYGFEHELVNSERLLDTFHVTRELRQRLQSQKISIDYRFVRDMELPDNEVVELGETIYTFQGDSYRLRRMRWQP